MSLFVGVVIIVWTNEFELLEIIHIQAIFLEP